MQFMLRFVFICIISLLLSSSVFAAVPELTIFAGAASKPATDEIIKAFEKKEGVKINISFGGSGFVLSQMALAKKGDIFFPGSSDYMEIAKKKGLVFPESEKYVVYLVPAINVQKGNPKNIRSLKDLARSDVRMAIANPEGVCVGLYAVEIMEKNLSVPEKMAMKKNIINYTESCEKTATAISLKAVDAVIGWRVFQYWDPSRIETVPLKKDEIARVGYIPIAISRFTTQRPLAQRFIDYILSEEGKAVFRKYHYFMTPEEAFTWIGEKKSVGGEYRLPAQWLTK
ncbi:MAG: molybdate ABC transporter substrate-binding protein [Syntrophorhabdus sp.]